MTVEPTSNNITPAIIAEASVPVKSDQSCAIVRLVKNIFSAISAFFDRCINRIFGTHFGEKIIPRKVEDNEIEEMNNMINSENEIEEIFSDTLETHEETITPEDVQNAINNLNNLNYIDSEL